MKYHRLIGVRALLRSNPMSYPYGLWREGVVQVCGIVDRELDATGFSPCRQVVESREWSALSLHSLLSTLHKFGLHPWRGRRLSRHDGERV